MELKASFVAYVPLDRTAQLPGVEGAQGALNGREVRPVATEPASARLGKRTETTGIKERLRNVLCVIARPFNDMAGRVRSVFPQAPDSRPARPAGPTGACASLSVEQLKAQMRAQALMCSFAPMAAAKQLQEITGHTLERGQLAMATGDGLLRRVATGLNGVVTAYQGRESDPPIHRDQSALVERAQALLERKVGGLAFGQWATTGEEGEQLAALPASLRGQPGVQVQLDAAVQCLEDAAAGMRQIAKDVLQLKQDVEAFHARPASLTVNRQQAPVTSKAGKAAEFSALFDKLGQSLPDGRNASRITIPRADMSFMLRSMREGFISSEGLRDQIRTKADLELVRSLYDARELQVASLDDALLEVAGSQGDQGRLLGNFSSALAHFVRTVAGQTNADPLAMAPVLPSSTPTDLRGALALQVREPMQRLDAESARRILQQLEGPLGTGVRVVLKVMVDETNALAQRDHKPVSAVYSRVDSLVSAMIRILRDQLSLPVRSASPTLVAGPRQLLTPQEWVALTRVMESVRPKP